MWIDIPASQSPHSIFSMGGGQNYLVDNYGVGVGYVKPRLSAFGVYLPAQVLSPITQFYLGGLHGSVYRSPKLTVSRWISI